MYKDPGTLVSDSRAVRCLENIRSLSFSVQEHVI